MTKMDEIEKVGLEELTKTIGLTKEEVQEYDDEMLSYYWFLRVNNLTRLKLSASEVKRIVNAGFLSSSAVMHSITHLTQLELESIENDTSPIETSIRQIYALPNCKSEMLDLSYLNYDSNWFSIQFGIYSINLPVYLWWMAVDLVKEMTDGFSFYLNLDNVSGGIPVLMLSFDKYKTSFPKDVVEHEMLNVKDPLLQCADDFLSLGLLRGEYDYKSKIVILYQLVRLYDIDPTWVYALFSPIQNRLVLAYVPGDGFLDTLWRCLEEDVPWVIKSEEHLHKSNIMILDIKVNLVNYALNPTVFVEKLKEGRNA